MTDLTEQEVCIGSLGQQKVYLHWSDVKDICTYAVSAAYEQVREENTKLQELLKECKHIMSIEKDFASCHFEKDKLCKLLAKINQALGEDK